MDRWLARAAAAASSEGRIALIEQGIGTVWRRAHRTLGEITLTAVAERVLHHSMERFAVLSPATVDTNGLRLEKLQRSSVPPEELAAALRHLLVELLSILGNLTDEIITPALHFELTNVAIGANPGGTESHEVAGSDEGEGKST